MIEPDSSSTATFETHASIIARNKSSGEPPVSVRTDVCLAALESIAAVHFPSDAKRHGWLFTDYQPISLHGLPMCEVTFTFESMLWTLNTVIAPRRIAKSFDPRYLFKSV